MASAALNTEKKMKVVIAGGGTAGWVAAVALSHHLGDLIEIELVESDDIGTIGVGEATIPTARTFHQYLGIDERAFMRATNATFKLGIAFENWGQLGDRYLHSFGAMPSPSWTTDFHHIWLRARAAGVADEIGVYSLETQACEAQKMGMGQAGAPNYAFHLDATLYARFLRQLSEARGVVRTEGKIAKVNQDSETGFITSLSLESGNEIAGDLFVDCTGFRALLIEETLKTGYDDWSKWLSTNSALAVQTASVGEPLPYTRSIARSAGWQWRIPLQSRTGNGLVYDKNQISDDDARAELLANLEGELLTEPRLIRYLTGKRKQQWNKNVVSLGLSSGFIEPLESTSIHLFMVGVTRLIQLFPFQGINPSLVARFNKIASTEMEHIRDFIILHYKLTRREDTPFWARCKNMDIPDSLATRIELFQENGIAYQAPDDLFRTDSWVQVMLGQGASPIRHHPTGYKLDAVTTGRALANMKDNIAKAVAAMGSHQQFINEYCPAK